MQNQVRARRLARGWSQQELADRAGLSRPGVSAIEAGRLAPSVTAAMALARALEASVEELFAPRGGGPARIEWAIMPSAREPRYWQARVGERILSYPVGEDSSHSEWHDGVARAGAASDAPPAIAERTFVVAGCDPAAALLAAEYARLFQFRMIVLRRSSRDALDLLAAGKVHAAGIHWGPSAGKAGNVQAARSRFGKRLVLIRVTSWEEGLAISPGMKCTSVDGVLRSKAQWVGREEGSGARQCQEEVLAGRPAPRRVAFDHRTVAAAIRCGWADVGPCVRLVSEESGLRFLKVHDKDYDLCVPSDVEADPRIAALLATLRSRGYRSRLADLPGYTVRETGEIVA
jgi:molybdate-binding protein/transcriptional regulator with XRE-family HTH domain